MIKLQVTLCQILYSYSMITIIDVMTDGVGDILPTLRCQDINILNPISTGEIISYRLTDGQDIFSLLWVQNKSSY